MFETRLTEQELLFKTLTSNFNLFISGNVFKMGLKNLAKVSIYSAMIALNYIMLPVYGGLDINTLKQ